MLNAAAIVIDRACEAPAPAASTTWRVKLDIPAAVGVPGMAPVLAPRLSPAGSAPAVTDQVSGAVPPAAAAVCAYAVPSVPPGRDVVVMLSADAITIDNA